jgi:hypothetical protein
LLRTRLSREGADTFDEKKTVCRPVFPADDSSAAINGTNALSGFDGSLNEGMLVDLVDGPRLNYWVVFNNQLVQYSCTVIPAALKAGARLHRRRRSFRTWCVLPACR